MTIAWRRLRRLQAYFRASRQRSLLDLADAAEVALASYIVSVAMYPGVENFRYFWVLLALIGALSRVWADQRLRQANAAAPAGGFRGAARSSIREGA